MKKKTTEHGYLILETLIAITVLAVLTVSLIPTISFMSQRSRRSVGDGQASLVAQTAIEAAYHVCLNDWESCIAARRYELIPNVSDPDKPAWELIELPPGETQTIQSKYKRSIDIVPILRDPVSGKSGSGSVDPESKKVVVSVQWSESGTDKKIQAELILTKFSS